MLSKILIPLIAIPLGLAMAIGVDNYTNGFQPTQVMSMTEELDPLVEVPQPVEYRRCSNPNCDCPNCNCNNCRCGNNNNCCNTRQVSYNNCGYGGGQSYFGYNGWWTRGPVRRAVAFNTMMVGAYWRAWATWRWG